MKPSRRVPVWMVCVIIIAALPVFSFPALLSASSASSVEGSKVYLWLYPAYVVAASLLAYQCYGRRTEMSWIIIVLMLLTHVAMWALVGAI